MELKLFCIVDQIEIPQYRAVRGSNTCCEDCRKVRDKMKRAQVDKKQCRHCGKPSTPEERRLFQRWRKAQPDYKPAKRGRPTKGSKAVTEKVHA